MKSELNRRRFLKWANLLGLSAVLPAATAAAKGSNPSAPREHGFEHPSGVAVAQAKEASPDTILLKNYRPKSIFKIPVTRIDKSKHPIIDMHSHPYAKTAQQIDEWLKNMDEVGVEKTMILTMTTGTEFDEIYRKYSKYPERFEVCRGIERA